MDEAREPGVASELLFQRVLGHAAKRDRGTNVPTDFVGRAWTAFRTGRAIIAGAQGPLSSEDALALVSPGTPQLWLSNN